MAEEYLLIKRDLYWRPEGAGYTGIKDNAGRYSREAAEKMVGHGVTMVKVEDAPDFTSACFDDLARDHLVKQRDEALAESARLRLWVRRIHNINDHPGRYSSQVDDACIDALDGLQPSGPVDAVIPTRKFAVKNG